MHTTIPPKYKADQNAEVLEQLADIISQIKIKHKDPLIITGGDYNNREHAVAHADTVDMVQLNTMPTRRGACLDVLYCNFVHDVVELDTREPLMTNSGIRSDHNCVFASFEIADTHIFTKRKITVRPRMKKG